MECGQSVMGFMRLALRVLSVLLLSGCPRTRAHRMARALEMPEVEDCLMVEDTLESEPPRCVY